MKQEYTIESFEGRAPQIDSTVFLAAGARIIGDVKIGAGASVWYNVVIRGDVGHIEIGDRTNIQDLVMCHLTTGRTPLLVGQDCTIGHGAILHGCTIEDGVLVGMNAVVLDEAIIGSGSIVAAGAVVTEGMRVPDGSLVAGVPARVVRTLDGEGRAAGSEGAENYVGYVARYRNKP